MLCITSLWPYVTNEQISIVISLVFSSILDLSQSVTPQHSMLHTHLCHISLLTSFTDKGPPSKSNSYSPGKKFQAFYEVRI
jgi:hypothetical protein